MKSFFTNLKQRYNIRDYKISLVFLVTLISLSESLWSEVQDLI